MQQAYAHFPIPSEAPNVTSELAKGNGKAGFPEIVEEVVSSQDERFPPRRALLRLTSFFALLIVLIFAVNALIGTGLKEIKTSSYGAWNQVMQGKVNADVIISGSSRAAYHYDPRVIESVTDHTAFNIGRAGTQTDVQVAVLKAYLEHNRKPKLVIHNLDAFSFVTSQQIFDPVLYVPYLGDKEIYNPLHRIDPSIAKSRYIPLYGYVVDDMDFTWIEGLKALVGVSPKQDYFLGFSPRDLKWSNDFRNFMAGNPHGASFAIDPLGIQALEQLIEVCQNNGIPLVLVYSPEYTAMQKMTNNRAEIFAHFKDLASRYHVPLWDYSGWKYDGDRNYFYNSQHLNATGAALFSDDLAYRLKTYFEENQQPIGRVEVSNAEPRANRDQD